MIPISKLNYIPDWELTPDPHFQKLFGDALDGKLPVYFAAIPTRLIRRFDATCRPEITISGRRVVDAITQAWREGKFQIIWVYECDGMFVASDDYFVVASVEAGKPDYCPCYVLGRPTHQEIRDIQGPIDHLKLRKGLGVE